jgi:hypothetical protein
MNMPACSLKSKPVDVRVGPLKGAGQSAVSVICGSCSSDVFAVPTLKLRKACKTNTAHKASQNISRHQTQSQMRMGRVELTNFAHELS